MEHVNLLKTLKIEAVLFLNRLNDLSFLAISTYEGIRYEVLSTPGLVYLGDVLFAKINGENVEFELVNGKIIFRNIKELMKRDLNKLIIWHSSKFSQHETTGVGPYKYYLQDQNDEMRPYFYLQSEPAYSKEFIPIFEDLSLKAIYTFKVIISKQDSAFSLTRPLKEIYLAAMNGPLLYKSILEYFEVECDTSTQNWLFQYSGFDNCFSEAKVIRFNSTPLISFNLLALVVGDFVSINKAHPIDGLPLSLICERHHKRLLKHNAKRLFKMIVAGLEFYESYFEVRYPNDQYTMVFLSNFQFNAMENPGMVCVSSMNMLDPSNTNYWTLLNRDRMVLHEMAHMWLGNLTTPSKWEDLWLKEATAEYLCHIAFRRFCSSLSDEGNIFNERDILINHIKRAGINFKYESFPFDDDSFPVCFKNDNSKMNVADYYGTIIFQKGSIYIKNLCWLIGEDNLKKILQNMVNDYSGLTISTNEFIELTIDSIPDINKADKRIIEDWAQSHLFQKGYPIIKVKKFEFDKMTRTLIVKMKVYFPKWTSSRSLILGQKGQVLIAELLLESSSNPKDNFITTEHIINNLEFTPLCYIPNCFFDDFIKVKLDNMTIKNLFCDPYNLQIYINSPETKIVLIEAMRQYRKSNTKIDVLNGILSMSSREPTAYLKELTRWAELELKDMTEIQFEQTLFSIAKP